MLFPKVWRSSPAAIVGFTTIPHNLPRGASYEPRFGGVKPILAGLEKNISMGRNGLGSGEPGWGGSPVRGAGKG